MKRVYATRIIALLIIVVLIWQYVEKRQDLQCYVRQLASRHEFVFKAGYASEVEIREIVFKDTTADFHGQAWRASLDQIFQAIFMGGNRGAQVVAYLTNPPVRLRPPTIARFLLVMVPLNGQSGTTSRYHCLAIETTPVRTIKPADARGVTTALQIPLRTRRIAALRGGGRSLTFIYKGNWNDGIQ